MKIKVVWTLLSSCVPGSRTGSSYRAVILLMQFHIDPNWSCNNLKRAYLCQAERVSFSTDVINLKETWSSWCWKCLHFPISNWLGTIAWALYLACKSFIPIWILLWPFCSWGRRTNGICEKPAHWRHSCRGLLQAFIPASVTFLQLPCALGKGCAVADSSPSAPLLAACSLGTCNLMCHTESRALSYLGLGFSLFWFPLTSQWEMLSNLYLILWLEAV